MIRSFIICISTLFLASHRICKNGKLVLVCYKKDNYCINLAMFFSFTTNQSDTKRHKLQAEHAFFVGVSRNQ